MIKSLHVRAATTAILAACLALLAACGGVNIAPSSHADARAPIRLTAAERESLRLGMRVYLESIQHIIDALAEHKISGVPEAARRAGMGMVEDVPASLAVKLPPDFVILSVDTHQRFDALALAAAESGSKSVVLKHLRDILPNCTSCHATYRLAPE